MIIQIDPLIRLEETHYYFIEIRLVESNILKFMVGS